MLWKSLQVKGAAAWQPLKRKIKSPQEFRDYSLLSLNLNTGETTSTWLLR
uniref:Uncharacterized protein n=1 Tax=Anguilla anguilla TaxID=7936 RepID=A0A0E9RND5_ANGAN